MDEDKLMQVIGAIAGVLFIIGFIWFIIVALIAIFS